MKQLEVFNKIGGIIKELNDQYKYIEDNPANLNELELELFVANAKFLADHAEILIRLNKQNKTEKPAEKVQTIKEKYFEPVVHQPKAEPKGKALPEVTAESTPSIDLSTGVPEDSYSFIREEPEVIRHELEIDEADTFDEVEENAEEVVEQEKPAEEEEVEEQVIPIEPEEIKPVAKKEPISKEEVVTINQKMSAQVSGKASLAEVQPITNLKQAITLNDKLLYVKDLFNGYSLSYSEAIEILNRFTSIEEAERFLNKNYVIKNNWESKPETSEKFFALLRRRYS